MIFMDPDGRAYVGRPPSTISLASSSMSRHGNTSPWGAVAISRSWRHLFPPSGWEYTVVRVLHRVQEVRELLREDGNELAEPIHALLKHEGWSQEQQAVVSAVAEDYQQAMQAIDQAFVQMLQRFPREIALLEQASRGGTVAP